jgi:hypothetical protein
MDDHVRQVAWAIAEAWWRKTHRQAAGVLLDADNAADYADRCWQEWTSEARSALKAVESGAEPPELAHLIETAATEFRRQFEIKPNGCQPE